MSYFYSENWDSDPVPFTPYSPLHCHEPLSFLSPLHNPLSPVWIQPIPLPDIAYQAAKGTHISYLPSPVNEECSPSPELCYPSPVQSPVEERTQERPFTIFSPVPGTNCFKSPSPIPETHQVPSPSSHSRHSADIVPCNQSPQHPFSPIDYEAAARGVGYQSPPQVPSPEPHPDQENIPPVPVRHPPLCICSREVHPHQYIAIHTPLGEEWHPLDKVYQDSITTIRTAEQLCTVPPVFTGVIPFRQSAPHYLTIYPCQHLAVAAGFQPLYTCSQAIRDQSSPDLPLGSIKYNFRRGIAEAVTGLHNLVRNTYKGVLVIVEIHNFLDRHMVTTYSYLHFNHRFGVDQTFIVNQGYHFEDAVRTSPHLYSYCFMPRIPEDPFDFISTYFKDEPL